LPLLTNILLNKINTISVYFLVLAHWALAGRSRGSVKKLTPSEVSSLPAKLCLHCRRARK